MRNLVRLACALALVAVLVSSVVTGFRGAQPVHALTTQVIKTYTGAITAETTVITGTAGTALHVHSLDIAATTSSSVWKFRDGTAGTIVFDIYLVGGTPQTVTKQLGADGLALTQNVLTAEPVTSNATLTLNARCSNQ